ncbi:MAG: hypothetical protein R2692_03865 [Microbacterium sp.]
MPLVIPRDVQLLALARIRLRAKRTPGYGSVHPELAADAVFLAQRSARSPGGAPRVVDLPWELVRGSTTR